MQRVVLTRTEPKLLLNARLIPLEGSAAARRAKRGPSSKGRSRTTSKGTTPPRKHTTGKRTHSGKAAASAAKKPARSGGAGKAPPGLVTVVKSDHADVALIVIDVRPIWAEVWIDGQNVGHTPLQRSLPPGKHKVELKNAQYKYQRAVTINARLGRKVKIRETLSAPEGGGGGGGGGGG